MKSHRQAQSSVTWECQEAWFMGSTICQFLTTVQVRDLGLTVTRNLKKKKKLSSWFISFLLLNRASTCYIYFSFFSCTEITSPGLISSYQLGHKGFIGLLSLATLESLSLFVTSQPFFAKTSSAWVLYMYFVHGFKCFSRSPWAVLKDWKELSSCRRCELDELGEHPQHRVQGLSKCTLPRADSRWGILWVHLKPIPACPSAFWH